MLRENVSIFPIFFDMFFQHVDCIDISGKSVVHPREQRGLYPSQLEEWSTLKVKTKVKREIDRAWYPNPDSLTAGKLSSSSYQETNDHRDFFSPQDIPQS